MKAISDTLIHFLGRGVKDNPAQQLVLFKEILQKGLLCSYVETTFSFFGIVTNSAVCFTDVPLNFCDDHTCVYGKFGIGFKKSFIKRVGGNPARYFVDHPLTQKTVKGVFESRGVLFYNLTEILKSILILKEEVEKDDFDGLYVKNGNKLFSKEGVQNFINLAIMGFSFDKPIGDLGSARDDTDDTDVYYKEREWRIVPTNAAMSNGSIIKVTKDKDFYYIPFSRKDVRIIIVPNDDIKSMIINWFLEMRGSTTDVRLASFGLDIPPILNYDELKYF